jgi:transcriptional regulator with XRE-family HTH domain
MVARGRKKPAAEQPVDEPGDGTLDVNAVVSYNIRAIRERRGMTQTGVAERLAQLTGHLLPQASISAMERGFDGERRRRFDAHELYLLSVVFDVPIAYFFIPPPGLTGIELADTRRPVAELYRSLLGTDAQLEEMDRRLDDIKIQNPDGTDDVLTALFGADPGAGNWHQHFRTWRAQRLREVEREYGTQLDEVADFLADFAAKIKAVGPSGYLQSMDWQDESRPPLDGEE